MPDDDFTKLLVAVGRIEQQLSDLSKTMREDNGRLSVETERNRVSIHSLRDELHRHLVAEAERPCREHAHFFTVRLPAIESRLAMHDRVIWIGGGIIIAGEIIIKLLWK